MFQIARNLAIKFWYDDEGSVFAAEYLLVGTVVIFTAVVAMQSLRDEALGMAYDHTQTLRAVRQAYSIQAIQFRSPLSSSVRYVNPAFASYQTIPYQANAYQNACSCVGYAVPDVYNQPLTACGQPLPSMPYIIMNQRTIQPAVQPLADQQCTLAN